MKRVVLIRHAEPEREGGPLSLTGEATQRRASRRLKEEIENVETIFSSPLLRALETAEILAEEFSKDVFVLEALGDFFDANELMSHIYQAKEGSTLLFIGHAPTLAHFAYQLLGQNYLKEGFQKSAALIVEFPEEMAFGKANFIRYLEP